VNTQHSVNSFSEITLVSMEPEPRIRFLGIDLGWQSGPSGLCCLTWEDGTLGMTVLERLTTVEEILTWVDDWTAGLADAVVAVDAPTLIPNRTGMRLPDRLAHQYFGKYDAGCYPANRGRPFANKLIAFGLALEARGFCHAPHRSPQPSGKFQLEVFPHPVTVQLFQLPKILKYKKGRLAERRPELEKLRQYQLSVLPTLEPALALTDTDLPTIPQTGTAMKAVEDQLDSLTCAYAAAHWWYWGTERNWVLGDVDEGYIVVPAPME
jgi:predicted RNase H-like nuclease